VDLLKGFGRLIEGNDDLQDSTTQKPLGIWRNDETQISHSSGCSREHGKALKMGGGKDETTMEKVDESERMTTYLGDEPSADVCATHTLALFASTLPMAEKLCTSCQNDDLTSCFFNAFQPGTTWI
jgi:hypothetical protein